MTISLSTSLNPKFALGPTSMYQDHRGYKAQRDMVNYVSLMELRFKGEATLAKATLEELPDQVDEYFKRNSN